MHLSFILIQILWQGYVDSECMWNESPLTTSNPENQNTTQNWEIEMNMT
jgi:hypothetical protein